MTPTITTFRWVPEFARGFVRDLRPRWAFEEVGQHYEVELIDQGRTPEHCRRQPFGQVPTYRDDEIEIFESGAIVLRIAEQAGKLIPIDPAERIRAIQWLACALNSVEPWVMALATNDVFEATRAWSQMRHGKVVEDLHGRLRDLEASLGDKPWLDGDDFTVGDLMMVSVLGGLRGTGQLEGFPALAAYVERGEARPAHRKAMADQLALYDNAVPARDATQRRDMMNYIDGFLAPVSPGTSREAYAAFAEKTALIFKEHGATRVVEGWADDVPDGKVTDFRRAVQAVVGETVVFSWIEWPDKATRDAGMKQVMEDPRMQPGAAPMPFDGKRLVFGGFQAVVDA